MSFEYVLLINYDNFYLITGKSFISNINATPDVRKALGDVKNQRINSTQRSIVNPTPQKTNFIKHVSVFEQTIY